MRTLRALATVPVVAGLLAAGLLAGCASGENTSPGDTFARGTLNPADRNTVAQVTYSGTAPDSVPTGPVQFDVRVGIDSSPNRVERVRSGSGITLNLTDTTSAQDYLVHGVDQEQKVKANVTATFNFTLTAPGSYPVESLGTGTVLLVIEVI